MECFLECLPPRLLGFIVGLAILGAGIYGFRAVWQESGQVRRALGPQGVTVQAEVRSRFTGYSDTTTNDGNTTEYTKISVLYDYAGETHRVDLIASGTPLENAREGDKLNLRLHPSQPELLFHPDTKPPNRLLYIPAVLAIGLGLLLALAILVSLAEG